jgi:hypothetical protein
MFAIEESSGETPKFIPDAGTTCPVHVSRYICPPPYLPASAGWNGAEKSNCVCGMPYISTYGPGMPGELIHVASLYDDGTARLLLSNPMSYVGDSPLGPKGSDNEKEEL